MKVIINSDVIFHQGLVTTSFSQDFERFLEALRDGGHELIVPNTTEMEFTRAQREIATGYRESLAKAVATLDRYGIRHDAVDASKAIPDADLIGLITARKVRVS